MLQEFLAKCRGSQELIYTQIPWASAGAERSRLERIAHRHTRTHSVTRGSQQDLILADTEDVPGELTIEEELLAALLDAHEGLISALRMYDDHSRLATEQATEERSRREVRMDRRVSSILSLCFICIHGIPIAIKRGLFRRASGRAYRLA